MGDASPVPPSLVSSLSLKARATVAGHRWPFQAPTLCEQGFLLEGTMVGS